MFTVEMDYDGGHAIRIVSLDQADMFDSLEVILYKDEAHLIQYNEEYDAPQNMLIISIQQFFEIFAALSQTEGAYFLKE